MYFICIFPGVYKASLICDDDFHRFGKSISQFLIKYCFYPILFLLSFWNFDYLYMRPFHHLPYVSYTPFCILYSSISQCLSLEFFFWFIFSSLILSFNCIYAVKPIHWVLNQFLLFLSRISISFFIKPLKIINFV